MEHRIAKKKLLFYHHLVSLPEDTLASEVARMQSTLSYPGLISECEVLLMNYELPPVSSTSKLSWKKLVNQKICEKNRYDLLEKIRPPAYKKLDFETLSAEKFERKEYLDKLNLADARLRFSLRAKMTKTVQMNFKNDRKYKQNQWKCQDCQIPDTQDHIVRCPAYQSLRADKDLSNDKDLVSYFRKVIKIREKLEDERT